MKKRIFVCFWQFSPFVCQKIKSFLPIFTLQSFLKIDGIDLLSSIDLDRIDPVDLWKRLTVIESILSIFKKDRPWANQYCRSLQKIDRSNSIRSNRSFYYKKQAIRTTIRLVICWPLIRKSPEKKKLLLYADSQVNKLLVCWQPCPHIPKMLTAKSAYSTYFLTAKCQVHIFLICWLHKSPTNQEPVLHWISKKYNMCSIKMSSPYMVLVQGLYSLKPNMDSADSRISWHLPF